MHYFATLFWFNLVGAQYIQLGIQALIITSLDPYFWCHKVFDIVTIHFDTVTIDKVIDLWHQKHGPLLSQSQLTTCSLNHFAKYLVNLSSSLCCECLPLWPWNTICYLHVVVVLLHCWTKNIKLFWIWPSIILAFWADMAPLKGPQPHSVSIRARINKRSEYGLRTGTKGFITGFYTGEGKGI